MPCILEAHIGDFAVPAEVRPDVQIKHLSVGAHGGRPLAHDVLCLESLDQFSHGRRGALVLDVPKGIAAVIDQPLKLSGLLARRRHRPVRKPAEGEAPLAPRPGDIIEN